MGLFQDDVTLLLSGNELLDFQTVAYSKKMTLSVRVKEKAPPPSATATYHLILTPSDPSRSDPPPFLSLS